MGIFQQANWMNFFTIFCDLVLTILKPDSTFLKWVQKKFKKEYKFFLDTNNSSLFANALNLKLLRYIQKHGPLSDSNCEPNDYIQLVSRSEIKNNDLFINTLYYLSEFIKCTLVIFEKKTGKTLFKSTPSIHLCISKPLIIYFDNNKFYISKDQSEIPVHISKNDNQIPIFISTNISLSHSSNFNNTKSVSFASTSLETTFVTSSIISPISSFIPLSPLIKPIQNQNHDFKSYIPNINSDLDLLTPDILLPSKTELPPISLSCPEVSLSEVSEIYNQKLNFESNSFIDQSNNFLNNIPSSTNLITSKKKRGRPPKILIPNENSQYQNSQLSFSTHNTLSPTDLLSYPKISHSKFPEIYDQLSNSDSNSFTDQSIKLPDYIPPSNSITTTIVTPVSTSITSTTINKRKRGRPPKLQEKEIIIKSNKKMKKNEQNNDSIIDEDITNNITYLQVENKLQEQYKLASKASEYLRYMLNHVFHLEHAAYLKKFRCTLCPVHCLDTMLKKLPKKRGPKPNIHLSSSENDDDDFESDNDSGNQSIKKKQ